MVEHNQLIKQLHITVHTEHYQLQLDQVIYSLVGTHLIQVEQEYMTQQK